MTPEEVEDGRYDLLFSVRRSRRYHMHRQAFFGRFNSAFTFLTTLSGSATFASVLAESALWSAVLAAVTAVVAAMSFAGQTSTRHALHGDLARKFTGLERDMMRAGEGIDVEELNDFTARRLKIEMREPPLLRVLNIMCHNEEIMARGLSAKPLPVKWWQRGMAAFLDLNVHRLLTEEHAALSPPSSKSQA